MGYPNLQKGYRVLDLSTKEFFVSRDVLFHENVFRFNEKTLSREESGTLSIPRQLEMDDTTYQDLHYIPLAVPTHNHHVQMNPSVAGPISNENQVPTNVSRNSPADSSANEEVEETFSTPAGESTSSLPRGDPPRRSSRATRPPI